VNRPASSGREATQGSRRRITFTRSVALSLAVAPQQPHLYGPADVIGSLERASRRNAKGLLVATGERLDRYPGVRARLTALGFEDLVAYVGWACERALERGLLPQTDVGPLATGELARLRQLTASQVLMMEPANHADAWLDSIRAAGELRIPITAGLVVGRGETGEDRVAALSALAELHGEHGHVQELMMVGPHGAACRRPVPIGLEEMTRLVSEARRLLPEVGVQVPLDRDGWWPQLVRAGATDLGGLSRHGDHSSPEHPSLSRHQIRKRLLEDGLALTERLCVHPQYIDANWLDQGVLDVIKTRFWSFIPRGGSGRTDAPRPIRRDLVAGAVARGRDGAELTPEELTALFAETRAEAIEDIRQAADELRAELVGETVTFVVNRNTNVSNICIVGCAFCGFGQGKRSPDAYEHSEEEFVARILEAVEYGATEICMQSGIHPDWTLDDYLRYLRLAQRTAPALHLHAYSPMEVAHICDMAGLSPAEVFGLLREAGLGSTPGTAAEVLHDGVRQRISPNKLPVSRWVEVIEASHRAGLRSTATVMFGHIEEPWELAEHMRVIRALQERTGGFTEFVPLSFIPFHTLLGRTHGVEEISREENLKHTAVFRLALGRTVKSLQASWVKMGLETATDALRWGVNDLGGTLMEESISRLAGSYHGVRLDPPELIAAAHRAGRPAAERTTLYAIRRDWPLPA
jgi:FO synthase